MPTKRKIVAEFTRDELWWITDNYQLTIEDRRRLDDLQSAVTRLSKAELRDILQALDRDRLKEICRALELDDSGKVKSDIVERLLGEDSSSDADSTANVRSTPKKAREAVLDQLSRDELIYIADMYGFDIEDRRKREDALAAAYRTNGSQFAEALSGFSRERLKELCRVFELDDGGKAKADLIERLIGGEHVGEKKDENHITEINNEEVDEKKMNPTESKKRKSRLFIGSTVEALPVAREIQTELHHEFEVTIWSQQLFSAGEGTWTRLVEMARKEFDFALLVFSADDAIETRDARVKSPRDNVLLEYGLFVGALGPDRTFFLYNADNRPKIASDLAGVTALIYHDREDENLQAAVGPACTALLKRSAKLGRRAT